MEADFSGYATKAGLKCSDGRTIMPDAFKHQDQMQVPLVWQHGHTDPENVLGHVLLQNKADGVFAQAFFNNSKKAEHARELVVHKDIRHLSIWANDLVERAKQVFHGTIREVSLVLSGANPGALIENVTIRHSDGDENILEDEAIIYTGLEFEAVDDVQHAAGDTNSGGQDSGRTIQDVYDSMTEEQKQVLHFMVGEALDSAGMMQQSSMNPNETLDLEAFKQEIIATIDTNTKGTEMKHNVFENNKDDKTTGPVLSHSDVESIVADATKTGSLKEAVTNYAVAHGIQDIDTLFPDAQAVSNTPELFSRRTEWVQNLLSGVSKSPFSRIKTLSADLTVAEARAKGYIKGHLKKEEFFRVSKRITTPTTIYKKQKLDRDDMVDITDFDVVAWLKGEMRLMLDEEVARAILVGDGRAVDDEDKISEDNIRPIASDHEIYTTVVSVNIDDSSSSIAEALDAIILYRSDLRGSGQPTLYTTEKYIARFLLLKDNTGRKLYRSLDEVASDLRVSAIVPVEVLEEYSDILCILVNPTDYRVGADKGGNVSMFDDFDIDYNQYKYLIETRMSGALTKLKSAMVVKKVASNLVLVSPNAPAFDGNDITITDQTGVVYRNAADDTVMNDAGSPYAVADGVTVTVNAEPASGYYFASSDDDSWRFTGV